MTLVMLVSASCGMFFFFFKQKTAYEMRISDWSSDVCSSDLFQHIVTFPCAQIFGTAMPREAAAMMLSCTRQPRFRRPAVDRDTTQEIGRASCRERVCQYV